tara:strand:- start:18163 stop:18366 length:204 start_codon:yes stop_codon:yes gene_type:complete
MFNLRKAVKVSLAVKGWNMDKLALAMCKNKRTIESSLYNGNPTLSTISNIASELGYSLSEFIKLGED